MPPPRQPGRGPAFVREPFIRASRARFPQRTIGSRWRLCCSRRRVRTRAQATGYAVQRRRLRRFGSGAKHGVFFCRRARRRRHESAARSIASAAPARPRGVERRRHLARSVAPRSFSATRRRRGQCGSRGSCGSNGMTDGRNGRRDHDEPRLKRARRRARRRRAPPRGAALRRARSIRRGDRARRALVDRPPAGETERARWPSTRRCAREARRRSYLEAARCDDREKRGKRAAPRTAGAPPSTPPRHACERHVLAHPPGRLFSDVFSATARAASRSDERDDASVAADSRRSFEASVEQGASCAVFKEARVGRRVADVSARLRVAVSSAGRR